jgi:hypothetical protein
MELFLCNIRQNNLKNLPFLLTSPPKLYHCDTVSWVVLMQHSSKQPKEHVPTVGTLFLLSGLVLMQHSSKQPKEPLKPTYSEGNPLKQLVFMFSLCGFIKGFIKIRNAMP